MSLFCGILVVCAVGLTAKLFPARSVSVILLTSGFPLFRTDKIPWLLPDFSSIFGHFSSIFLMFCFFFNWKFNPFY